MPRESARLARGDDLIVISRQEILDPAASALEAWALKVDPNFSDVEVDTMTSALHVYRAGENPADTLAKGYQAFIPLGYALDFKPAAVTASRERTLMANVTKL